MPSRRIQRVNQLLREEIAEILQREVRDEALSLPLISITEVDTTSDLRTARVYYSVYGDEETIMEARRHLERASGFLRRSMKGRVDLRQLPQLEFILDRSLATGDRIMQLMRRIEETLPPEEEAPAEGAEDADADAAAGT